MPPPKSPRVCLAAPAGRAGLPAASGNSQKPKRLHQDEGSPYRLMASPHQELARVRLILFAFLR